MADAIIALGGGAPFFSAGNGTYCTIMAPFQTSTSAISTAQILENPTYNIQLNAGVTAGTATFQEVWPDKVSWFNLGTPAPINLVSATSLAYNGVISGWFLGIRISIAGITGGTVQFLMLKAAVRSL